LGAVKGIGHGEEKAAGLAGSPWLLNQITAAFTPPEEVWAKLEAQKQRIDAKFADVGRELANRKAKLSAE
jgi:hypothetical protein